MNICDNRNAEFFTYARQNFESFKVANTRKRIEAAAVCLAIAAFEGELYAEALADIIYVTTDFIRHFFTFDGARSGKKEKA